MACIESNRDSKVKVAISSPLTKCPFGQNAPLKLDFNGTFCLVRVPIKYLLLSCFHCVKPAQTVGRTIAVVKHEEDLN